MPMPPPVGEAESNLIMIAVMDAKPITALVVLMRMGMAATPAATIYLPAATIFTPAARLSSTLSTAAQPKVADSILISTTKRLKIIIITWLNIFNQNNCDPFCNSPYLCQK